MRTHRKHDKHKLISKINNKESVVENNYNKLRKLLNENDTEESNIASVCRKTLIEANYYFEEYIKIADRLSKIKISLPKKEDSSIKEDEALELFILEKLKDSESALEEIKKILPTIDKTLKNIEKELKEKENYSDDDHQFVLSISGYFANFCLHSGPVIKKVEDIVKIRKKELPLSVIVALKKFVGANSSVPKELIRLSKYMLKILPSFIWEDLDVVLPNSMKSAALNLYDIGVFVDEYLVDYKDVRFPGL